MDLRIHHDTLRHQHKRRRSSRHNLPCDLLVDYTTARVLDFRFVLHQQEGRIALGSFVWKVFAVLQKMGEAWKFNHFGNVGDIWNFSEFG